MENKLAIKLHAMFSQIDALNLLIKEHQKVIQSNMNDFIVHDLKSLLHSEHFESIFCKKCEELANIGCCIDYQYGSCSQFCLKTDVGHQASDDTEFEKIGLKGGVKSLNTFLSVKKDHEVVSMSCYICKICLQIECNDVVDVGSGKGYLGQFLSDNSDLNVLGIEGCLDYSISAKSRQKQIQKLYMKDRAVSDSRTTNDFRTIRYEICIDTLEHSDDFIKIIKENMQKKVIADDNGAMLVGLHACGDLTTNSLKLFSKEPYFKALHIVGCCYNLCTEHGFPLSEYAKSKELYLGKNELMLACQSPEKWSGTNQELQKSLLYRAILQKIIYDKKIGDEVMKNVKFRGLGKKSKSFKDYMEYVSQQLSSDMAGILLSDADNYYTIYEDVWDEMKQLHWLKMQLAPCIEKLILLDRLCYLLECGFHNATVVKIFTATLSPRCYAILCDKRDKINL